MFLTVVLILLGLLFLILLLDRLAIRPVRKRLAEHAGPLAARPPFLIDYLRWLFWTLILLLLVRSFVVQPLYIEKNHAELGHYVLLERYAYGINVIFANEAWSSWAAPKLGDEVAVFNDGWQVGKVLALPGDEVVQLHHTLYVNGDQVSGVVASSQDKRADQYFVPEGHILLLVDEGQQKVMLLSFGRVAGRIGPVLWSDRLQ